jgi:hypothetical protein
LLRGVGQTRVTENYEQGGRRADPKVMELRAAVSRLRRELAAYPAEFRDRAIAEDELAALASMATSNAPEVPRMRRSLLLIVGSIGSVSALTSPLLAVRAAVDLFGNAPRPR